MPGLMTLSATLRRTGSRLLGHEDDAQAAFADLLQQLVGADCVRRAWSTAGCVGCDRQTSDGGFEEAAGFVVGDKQVLYAVTQGRVAAAGFLQVGDPTCQAASLTAATKISRALFTCSIMVYSRCNSSPFNAPLQPAIVRTRNGFFWRSGLLAVKLAVQPGPGVSPMLVGS